MAFANFQSRSVMAASQVLQQFSVDAFQDLLLDQLVGVAFDGPSIQSSDGLATIDLAVNLLARVHPRIALLPLDREARASTESVVQTAYGINPEIQIMSRPNKLVSCIVVGQTQVRPSWCPVYIGSEGWLVRLSPKGPVGTKTTLNPFSAGAAACFGAANTFRRVFSNQLPNGRDDCPFTLSLFNYEYGSKQPVVPPGPPHLGDSHLVGLGAIGNGTVWALSRLPALTGTLRVIDHDTVDLANLQRYVLTSQGDVGRKKVAIAKERLAQTELDVVPYDCPWETYAGESSNWNFEQVAVAVDSAKDRIGIQAALPRWIANAWTQPGDLGVSRHDFLGSQACLACLYLPDRMLPDEDEIVAEAIGLRSERMEVRRRLYQGTPLDRPFLQRIATAVNVPIEALLSFEGQPLRVFYSRAICGGAVFTLTKGATAIRAEVPLPFQSALAGILLGVELLSHANHYDRNLPVRTSIDLLRPAPKYLSTPHAKPSTARCICQDPDYIAAYHKKYGV